MSHGLPCSLCCFPTHPAFPVSLSFDLTLIYHWLYLIYCLLRAASLCLQSSPPFLVEWVLLEPCRFSTVCILIPPGLCHWRLWLELLSRRWISTPVGSQWWRTDFTTKSQLPLDCFPSPASLSHRFSPHEALLHLNTLCKNCHLIPGHTNQHAKRLDWKDCPHTHLKLEQISFLIPEPPTETKIHMARLRCKWRPWNCPSQSPGWTASQRK